jgi:hypothetical protein
MPRRRRRPDDDAGAAGTRPDGSRKLPWQPPSEAAAAGLERAKAERLAAVDAPPTQEEQIVAFILRLRIRGANKATIYRACRTEYGIGKTRIETLLATALEELRRDYEDRRSYSRAEQAARLRETIVRISEPREREKVIVTGRGKSRTRRIVKEALPTNYQALLRAEELLADVEGNREPLKVEVEHRLDVAMVAVVSSMRPERRQFLLDRARERKRLLLSVAPAQEQPHESRDRNVRSG